MATLVLSTVGGALGGPIGGLIGSIAGSFIDQALFGPKQQTVEGPRLNEIRLPSFDEGSPAPWLQGPLSRVACQVIFMGSASGPGKVEERAVTSGGGGKGGGGAGATPATTNYDYYVTVALGVARQSVTPSADSDGKFRPVRKLWANGTLIYNADQNNAATSTEVSVIKNTKNKSFNTTGCVDKPFQEEIIYEHQTSATFFQSTAFLPIVNKVTVAGFASGANNGTFSIVRTEVVGGKSRLVVFKCEHAYKAGIGSEALDCIEQTSCTPAVAEAAGASVTFGQSLDAFDRAMLDDVRQYCGGKDQDGTAPQGVDPTLAAIDGAGLTPAHRGTVYIVVKNLKITNWGGSIPTFEALVQENGTRTVGEAIVNIATRSGALTAADFDVSGATSNLLGLVMMGPKDPKSFILMLLNVYDLEVQERASVDGAGAFKNKLVFFLKASADLRTVVDGDRGARVPDQEVEGKDLISVEQSDPFQLPAAVSVQYVDTDEDYQPGVSTFRRLGLVSEAQVSLSLPLTLSQTNAVALAKKLLWSYHTNGRFKLGTSLPPTYINVAEADRIDVADAAGLVFRARVTKADRGANGLILVEAFQEVETIYSEPASGETEPGA